jgi:hypothetical protein
MKVAATATGGVFSWSYYTPSTILSILWCQNQPDNPFVETALHLWGPPGNCFNDVSPNAGINHQICEYGN